MVGPLDIAILALRAALVLLLYAFLATVVQFARSALAAEPIDAAAPPPTERPALLRLRVLQSGASGLSSGGILEVHANAIAGRSASANICLEDATVSGQHARLQRAGGRWSVADLHSTNGTYLDGERLIPDRPRELSVGKRLQLGAIEFEVLRS